LSSDKWQIKDAIRQMVQFREGNLLQDFGPMGVFDVVYCRNILIYFDQMTKAKVLGAIGGILAPDGALLLGGTETVLGVSEKFNPMGSEHGVYVLSGYDTGPAKAAVG